MKRTVLLLFLALTAFAASAQQVKEVRRVKHNFEFPEFREGKIIQSFGRYVKDTVNIFLKDASLCFLREGKVYQADLTNVIGLEIDSISYKKVKNQMGRVVAQKNYNALLCVTTVDMKRYQAETFGTEQLPFTEITLGTGESLLLELNTNEREDEKGIPLMDTYYFFLKGEIVPANETKIKKHIRPEMKDAFKNLMKDRFWSWNDPQNLSVLLMYF